MIVLKDASLSRHPSQKRCTWCRNDF